MAYLGRSGGSDRPTFPIGTGVRLFYSSRRPGRRTTFHGNIHLSGAVAQAGLPRPNLNYAARIIGGYQRGCRLATVETRPRIVTCISNFIRSDSLFWHETRSGFRPENRGTSCAVHSGPSSNTWRALHHARTRATASSAISVRMP